MVPLDPKQTKRNYSVFHPFSVLSSSYPTKIIREDPSLQPSNINELVALSGNLGVITELAFLGRYLAGIAIIEIRNRHSC